MISEKDKRELALAFRKSKRSLVNFRHILLSNDADIEVSPAPFHAKWSEILLKGDENFAIQAFRESAKTQYIIRAFPLHALTFPRTETDYIVLIKKNQKLARNKLKEIEREFLSNKAISSNLKKIYEESGDIFAVDVEDADGNLINVRIEAYGKGASVRGLAFLDRRPKIVIIDDPQDVEDAQSETVQETDWNWFLSDVMFLGKNSRIFMIGNNLGERCIIERIFAQPRELKFQTIRIQCIDEKTGDSSWPDSYTKEDMDAEKDAFRRLGKLDIWFREKMCVAISDELRTFRREDFKTYGPQRNAERIAADCNVYIRTDLAISEKKSADFSVIVIVGINQDNFWFVLDIIYGHFDPTTFIDLLFKAVVQWKPMNVGFPKVAYEAALEHFVIKEMPKRNVFFSVVTQKQEIQKELRIMALQPRFKAHTIFTPNDVPWLTELENELLFFPKSLRDDIIDALGSVEQETQAPFGRQQTSNLPRRGKMDAC